MGKTVWATGLGLVILGAFAAAALQREGHFQERIADLEDRIAALEGAVRHPGAPAAASAVAGGAPAAKSGSSSAGSRPPEGSAGRFTEVSPTEGHSSAPPPRIPPPPRDSRGRGDADPQDLDAGGITDRWQWSVFAGFLQLDPKQAEELEPVYRGLALKMTSARESLRSSGDYGLSRIRDLDRDMKQMLYDQAITRVNASQAASLKSWCNPPSLDVAR